jgi:beta-phosphoglucomutase-like phosphatase (HAD superfamily)
MASDAIGEVAPAKARLVIFDFDGAVADSEAIALEELAAEMTVRGAPVSYEETRTLFLGVSTSTHMAFISEKSGKSCGSDFPEVWHGRHLKAKDREERMTPAACTTHARAIFAHRFIATARSSR